MPQALATFLEHHPVFAIAVSAFVALALVLGVLHELALILAVLRVFVRAVKQHLVHIGTEARALWSELTTWDDGP